MKRIQLSGASKRQLAKDKQEKKVELESKIPKLTSFFTQTSQTNFQFDDEKPSTSSQTVENADCMPPEIKYDDMEIPEALEENSDETNFTTNHTLYVKSLESTPNINDSRFSKCFDVEISSENANFESQPDNTEMMQSAKDDVNMSKDPGLWGDFSPSNVSYWIACGPSDCQHHNGPFDNSCRNFTGVKKKRYCSEKLFIGRKPNGEKYKREWLLYSPSKGSVYCFVCKLFSQKDLNFVSKEGFSDWRNTVVISNHENSNTHRDCMLIYLTRRQGSGVDGELEKQIQEVCDYWEHVLRRVIAVICTLTERGLAIRGTEEKFGSLHNGNFLGLLELISQFDPFLASHIVKYGNRGKGNTSYLSKTICEELIELMAKKVHTVIVDEIKSSGYFSLSVDSTPDLSHVDQLSIIIRYLKDGKPVERFLTFVEMKNHTGEEMANQVLQYLNDVCQINFSKCRGQSYDNAANMSGRYNGMQQKILENNKFAIYVPCAAHSLNLVGRCAVDCCIEAVNFFSVLQLLYNFFSASTSRWNILKSFIGDENVLKSLSNTRWEAHFKATEAVLNSYSGILDALESIVEDINQKGDARKEADSIAHKMEELEFAFMLIFWNTILEHFHRVSQVLQNKDSNLEVCANLYESLFDQLMNSRENFDTYEANAKKLVPNANYRAALSRTRIRKKMPNDGDAPEVHLSPRDKFHITTFNVIIDKLANEMQRRGNIYKDISHKFSFLSDVSENDCLLTVSSVETDKMYQYCQRLIAAYSEDLNANFSAELKQFHVYVRRKLSSLKNEKIKFTHAELYKIMVEDKLECAFPNVEIAFRIFLTFMITNCSAERSFSQLKHIKSPLRTTMQQNRLDALSVLKIEADLLRNINFENIIKDFAIKKSRKKLFKLK